MTGGVRIPRSRGSLCGLALLLLGGWGGVAPFAGPSFGYGFTPDRAWAYTQGRLYLSAVPGAVVLVAGLLILITRSRGFGGFCALVAALGGAWFIAGAALIRLLPAGQVAGISTGSPIGSGTSRIVLTSLSFFAGTGALIIFFAALALGRFSIAAYKDYAGLGADLDDTAGLSSYPTTQQQYLPGQAQYPSQYTPGLDTFPTDQYPAHDQQAAEQYPSHGAFGLTQDAYPGSQSPFPPAPNPFGAPQTIGQEEHTTPDATT